ncbi:integrin alpha-4-like [Maniola jurtina]|uniref:integrin alpha-4-like n=1 Tax=Maniola jurtina TaxID=191418 RepID=UPI001E689973|nr:integrin alpha-4-like [Maniola jurtina]
MTCFTVIFFTAAILPTLGFFHEPSTITKTSPGLLKQDAYFGYSMACDEKTLLIGAPAADQFGKIFEFNLEKNMSAKILSPLITPEIDAWLGATIKSFGPRSFVVCAPRNSRPGISTPKTTITWGRCYILSLQNEANWNNLPNIALTDLAYFNLGNTAFGWSVDVDDYRNIWIASPVIKHNSIIIYEESNNFTSARFLVTNSLENPVDFVNLGYSIVSGNFLSETGSDHAVSYTYGDGGRGKVFIFEKRVKKFEVSGDEDSVGSTYGAVLCKAQLGHKRASLLVGAPTYAMAGDGYDRGAVYLYVPNDEESKIITFKRVIKGEKDAGYFGHAIASLGDMDGDLRDEVAIGAPFEDEGKGVVYIYSGAGLLSDRTWVQRIERAAKSFGFSLLPLPDYSGNGLNGLSVGAPFENKVYIITPIPPITINVDAVLPNSQVSRKNLSYVDFTIVVDVIYPAVTKPIIAMLEVKLQIEHPNATLDHGISDGTIMYNLIVNQTLKSETPLKILTPLNGYYDVPVSYIISVKLLNESEKQDKLSLVLLSERSNVTKRGVLWVSDCKAQHHCMPNLNVDLQTAISDPYTVGSSDKEYFSLVVRNTGETAYTPCAVVNVQAVRVLRPAPGCELDTSHLVCRPTHPLHHNGEWNINNIELEMDSLTSKKENINSINILYDVYNDCNNKSDKKSFKKSFALRYDTGIHLIGISVPSEPVEITSSDLKNVTRLQHHYTIMNNGVMNWAGVTCNILLPKRNYLQYPNNVMMRRDSSMIPCPFAEEKQSKDTITAACFIGDIHKNNIIEVLIDVEVVPDSLGNALQRESVTIRSQLTLKLLKEDLISKNITTTLVLNKVSVPVWVIILSVLFAFLILLLVGFILYKYNCFERKNKKKLEDLKTKKSIRRPNEISDGGGNYKTLEEDDNTVDMEPSIDLSVAARVDHSVSHGVAPAAVASSVAPCVDPTVEHGVNQSIKAELHNK